MTGDSKVVDVTEILQGGTLKLDLATQSTQINVGDSSYLLTSESKLRLGDVSCGETHLGIYLQTDEGDIEIGNLNPSGMTPFSYFGVGAEAVVQAPDIEIGKIQDTSSTKFKVWNGSFWQAVPSGIPKENVQVLHRTELKTFLEAQDGKFVGALFIKKDKTVRHLNGRLGVTKHLADDSNHESSVEAKDRPYLTIFDMQRSEYRTLNLATLYTLRAQKHFYIIKD